MDAHEKQYIKNHVERLKNMFEVVRIVDPIKNKVHFTEGMDKAPQDISCYSFWKKGEVCTNCISALCIEEDRAVTKVEYTEEDAFLVIAAPIVIEDKKYAIEILLNIDNIDIINDLNKEHDKRVQGVITGLEEDLMLDELTEVYNRRFINKYLPNNVEGEKSKDIDKLAVIMLDIDDFKEINDIYGHLAGDHVLQKIAKIIDSRIRADFDWVARYGGDEFIILLKNVNESVVKRVLGEIQKELANTILISRAPEMKITLSFGVHILEPGTMNFEEVIEIVDKNLSHAKHSGKNKIVIS